MNGELAALIALCLHGNDWLASGTERPPALDRDNSAFRYVENVHVTCAQRRLLGTRKWEADGVAEWLRFVKDSGGRRLSLVVGGAQPADLPAPVAASFANGGRWALVDDALTPHLWQSHWAVHDRNRTDQRIWAVQLTGVPLDRSGVVQPPSSSARDDLRAALDAIKGFAERDVDIAEWASWFTEALGLLDAPEPAIPYNPDLAPEGLPLESRQLLAAAVKSWVFGGMGSWNDLAYSDAARGAEYDQRTDELYRSVLAALIAVTGGPLSVRV
ncbi:hypothetical protein [Leifsonia sp. TF02-11]|uniref:hypothetical protein n=1 Tax=Leifsonia sp. TF02-11 TaxID=2815212 RepID=UPI001AA0BF8A|nr:hypothetical protein [Leifsonia sp. TF02-11]